MVQFGTSLASSFPSMPQLHGFEKTSSLSIVDYTVIILITTKARTLQQNIHILKTFKHVI